ncbi:tRNA pseudouridine synthase B [Clostridia bacterium]|nr:tRNA pseudouridine synthase B [Clostridia bacterium]
MNGIIVINKPQDFTSFDVVALMRGLSKQKKIGHTGTLDPMATGVLPLLFGSATKAQSLLPDSNKEYSAKFKLGITTDTLDITGKITAQNPVNVKSEDIQKLIPHFTGNILQLPPMYSAVQIDGKRLYDLARKGIEVKRDARSVCIHKLQLIDYDEKTATGSLYISCSSGTYIRTLVDDIGALLGCGGTLTSLCRTFACGYTLQNSITIEQAKQIAQNGKFEYFLHPTENLFVPYPQVNITLPQAVRFSNGGGLDISRLQLTEKIADKTIFRVKAPEEQFIGLGIINTEKQELTILKLFNQIT